MKTIKVKELLDLIRNDEADLPSYVIYNHIKFDLFFSENYEVDYKSNDDECIMDCLHESYYLSELLEVELQIPEAATPEKLEKVTFLPYSDKVKSITILAEKINEIIDKLNKDSE